MTLRRYGMRLALNAGMLMCMLPLAAAAQSWTGLRTEGPRIADAGNHNILLHGFGPGEWTNTEAYMIRWPDCDPGACRPAQHDALYGASEIHAVLTNLAGRENADTFEKQWKANEVTEADFARMQAWGANSFRLSINYHWLSPSDGVYLDSGWRWIDQVIAWGKAHNISIILCLHAAPGSQSNYLMADTPDPGKGIQPPVAHFWSEPAIYQPWTIHLWTAIAKRYANEPQVAGYDLLDEPMPPNRSSLRPFYLKLTSAIRAVDKNHILFVEGLDFAGKVAGMQALLPPWDDNMVLVFHKYWDKNDPASIQGYLDIRDKYHVPLWNGETGENTADWDRSMNDLLTKNDIGWNSWTYKKIDDHGSSAYSISAPAEYQAIKSYAECWYPGNTRCPQPSPAIATAALRKLAENAATSKCNYESGVVEALFGKQHSFGVSVTPVLQTLSPGASTRYTLSLLPFGVAGEIHLSASNLPPGVTANFSPAVTDVSGQSTLEVTAARDVKPGTYEIQVTGNGAQATQSVNLTLAIR